MVFFPRLWDYTLRHRSTQQQGKRTQREARVSEPIVPPQVETGAIWAATGRLWHMCLPQPAHLFMTDILKRTHASLPLFRLRCGTCMFGPLRVATEAAEHRPAGDPDGHCPGTQGEKRKVSGAPGAVLLAPLRPFPHLPLAPARATCCPTASACLGDLESSGRNTPRSQGTWGGRTQDGLDPSPEQHDGCDLQQATAPLISGGTQVLPTEHLQCQRLEITGLGPSPVPGPVAQRDLPLAPRSLVPW